MYSESANLYDLVYLNQGKDYAAEAAQIRELVQRYKKTDGNHLLDVACGTGLHAGYLREYFQVEGLDIAEDMIEAARKKYPDIPFHVGDMRGFDLVREFDVVTCLFSSIGYVEDTNQLNSAIASMNRHLKPGGVMLVEPWFSPDTWKPGTIHTIFVDKPDLKIVRMNLSEQRGRLSFFTLHFLVGTPEGVRYFNELHEMALFTREEYMEAFQNNGLKTIYDDTGLYGRGLYIGIKESA